MSLSCIGLARTAALLLCAAAAGGGASAALARHGSVQSSAPTQFTLTDTVTASPSSGSVGTFSASALVCPSGAFADQAVPGISITTKHTCDDGSGEVDSVARASNRWNFTGGTGRYAALRGGGPCQLTTTTDGKTIRTCQLLAAFDDVAPSGAVERFSASAARRARTAKIKASFEAADDVAGNAVRFKLGVRAGAHVLATRTGTTTGKPISFSLAVRLPKVARKLTLRVVLTDPVGNTRTLVRDAALRRSRR